MILLAVVLTLFFAAFQRITGPTHPATGILNADGQKVRFSLPRSGTEGKDTPVAIPSVSNTASGASTAVPTAGATLYYRAYPFVEGQTYTPVTMHWEKGKWIGFLPSQPAAGKLAYYVCADGVSYFEDTPLVIRYKGDVPAGILIPHILLMFISMFFAAMAGIAALCNNPLYKRYSLLTLIGLLSGGFFFGALVQYHAFGMYWSGFPLGRDLTDNKTLIALLAFLIAWGILLFAKKGGRWAVLAAAVVMLGGFCVPHSLGGSELDRETGRIESVR